MCDRPLTREDFLDVTDLFSVAAENCDGNLDHHWQMLQRRFSGNSPWDDVVPLYVAPPNGQADAGEQFRRLQTVANMVRHRGFASWSIEGVQITIDVFNPANELQLAYHENDAVVIAFVFAPVAGPASHNVYASSPKPSFYAAVEAAAEVLRPKSISIHGRLHSVFGAIAEGRMSASRSPWSLLYTASVVRHPGEERVHVLRDLCALVRSWPNDRLLVQVTRGFGGGMPREYEQIGTLLGMAPWTRYVEGSDPKTFQNTDETWPTRVREDGSAAANIELMQAGPALQRQALYQLQVAVLLQERGDAVRTFQAPLIGNRTRITVPLVLARTSGPDRCAYTQCEAWTAERVAALQDWIRDLRQESDSEVIVVARQLSNAVRDLPEVAEFIHLPYDDLPPLP